MRLSAGWKLWRVLPALLIAGCVTHPPVPAPAVAPGVAPHEGTPYDIVAAESLLTIRAYRGGSLASAGHNHLIACHALEGTVYVPAEPLRTSFEVRVPVSELTVDEPQLREGEHSEEFPPQVPEAAREGTRRNMLSEALLDAAHHPQIVLRATALEPAGPGKVLAHLQALVRDAPHALSVPVAYQLSGSAPGSAAQVVVTGETTIRQSELGLAPFSALLGALQVQDELRIRFRIVARAAPAR